MTSIKKHFQKFITRLNCGLCLKLIAFILRTNLLPVKIRNLIKKYRSYYPRNQIKTKIKINDNNLITMNLDLKIFGEREFFYYEYEKHVFAYFKRLIQLKNCFWDIGAYIGFYTLTAAHLMNGNGKVFSFEPLPENFSMLQKNVDLNNTHNITLLNVALSNTNQKGQIFSKNAHSRSSMAALDSKLFNINKTGIPIEICSANKLLENGIIEKPDLIKIDAEGHEEIIFNDLENLLRIPAAPDIICEILGSNKKLLDKLTIDYEYNAYEMSNEINEDRIKRVSRISNDRKQELFFSKALF